MTRITAGRAVALRDVCPAIVHDINNALVLLDVASMLAPQGLNGDFEAGLAMLRTTVARLEYLSDTESRCAVGCDLMDVLRRAVVGLAKGDRVALHGTGPKPWRGDARCLELAVAALLRAQFDASEESISVTVHHDELEARYIIASDAPMGPTEDGHAAIARVLGFKLAQHHRGEFAFADEMHAGWSVQLPSHPEA